MWADPQDGSGHLVLEVWKSDLVDYFVWLLKKDIADLKEKGSAESDSRARELEHRVEKLKSKAYWKWYANELQKYCQFRNLKTQRETSLPEELEHARCLRTWQSFDHCIWRACQEKPAQPRVAKEQDFLEQVKRGAWCLAGATRSPGGDS